MSNSEVTLDQFIVDDFTVGRGSSFLDRLFEETDASRIISRLSIETRDFIDIVSRDISVGAITETRLFDEDTFRRILVLGALELQRLFTELATFREIYRLTAETRDVLDTITRDISVGAISETRLFDEDTFRRVLVLGALSLNRLFTEVATFRDLSRLSIESRSFLDLLFRDISVGAISETRLFDEDTFRRVFVFGAILVSREFNEVATFRDLSRLVVETKALDDKITRTISRLSHEERNLTSEIFRELYRLTTENRSFDDLTTRQITVAPISEEKNLSDITTRDISRLSQEAREFGELTTRDIYRLSQEERNLSDVTTRDVYRLTTETRDFEDADASRIISRLQSEFRLLENLTTRTIDVFAINEERQFSEKTTRTIDVGAISETRIFEEIKTLRELTRQPDINRLFDEIISRKLSRQEIKERLFAFVGEAIVRRLDFDGYSNDVEILKQFAHKWMQEEYGALILQIIQRAAEERRNF